MKGEREGSSRTRLRALAEDGVAATGSPVRCGVVHGNSQLNFLVIFQKLVKTVFK